ncbi:fructose-1,6-bisphosphatase II / sedoheptulose-1,7-bisphosphatase [Devosia subaequoris]|uniref:Fructose-1,6-bisphosphatase n=1 Tax=Devosia subaequoris TaxID=395930 RepID=A0A7W6IJJ9_9HYPH|nr:class II fructose-bisphosphatase [Devosia subaequoris]MBB4050749.1 fructose-1,6-bisphosphatase II / sedoheptulose-1,7-bisphosphatase [Devosia subaequoris]MCP1208571.1 class II fructose-bisphosphatase [Devosia subaequoris]
MKLSKVENGRDPANLHRTLTLEMVRVTERAAIAAAEWRGKGNEKAADEAAVAAMKAELDELAISGRIVIGEGEQYECDDLFVGQSVGQGQGPEVDIAVDPLEGVTLCAKNQPDSLVVLAMAERGGLLNVARNVYMHKIAIGAEYSPETVHIEWSATENVKALAKAKGVPISEITAIVLDRPRHGGLLEELRTAGVSVKLLSDGDIAGVIHAVNTADTGVDIYLGSGGAPEGVLAAAALRCIGGQMQGKLILDTPDKRMHAKDMGITDPNRIYDVTELASGDVLFSATGVTDGSLAEGVRLRRGWVETSTVVMRSWSQTTRWIKARHAR